MKFYRHRVQRAYSNTGFIFEGAGVWEFSEEPPDKYMEILEEKEYERRKRMRPGLPVSKWRIVLSHEINEVAYKNRSEYSIPVNIYIFAT